MDGKMFDRLTRLVSSRRSVGLALGAATLHGLAEAARAKKQKKRHCKKTRNGARCDGTTCDGFSIKTCHSKKFGRCRCREGTTCLANTSCGPSCAAGCPEGCVCAVGGEQVCLQTPYVCDEVPPCSSTADCPLRTACTETECGPSATIEKRCVPLCGESSVPQQP